MEKWKTLASHLVQRRVVREGLILLLCHLCDCTTPCDEPNTPEVRSDLNKEKTKRKMTKWIWKRRWKRERRTGYSFHLALTGKNKYYLKFERARKHGIFGSLSTLNITNKLFSWAEPTCRYLTSQSMWYLRPFFYSYAYSTQLFNSFTTSIYQVPPLFVTFITTLAILWESIYLYLNMLRTEANGLIFTREKTAIQHYKEQKDLLAVLSAAELPELNSSARN